MSSFASHRPRSAPPQSWCCRTESCVARRQNTRRRGCGLPGTLLSFRPERPSRSSHRTAAGPSPDSEPCTPLRRSPPSLRRSRPAHLPADERAARTSRAGSASSAARNPSRSCSRPCIGVRRAAARRSAWLYDAASSLRPCRLPGSDRWFRSRHAAWAAAPLAAADSPAAPSNISVRIADVTARLAVFGDRLSGASHRSSARFQYAAHLTDSNSNIVYPGTPAPGRHGMDVTRNSETASADQEPTNASAKGNTLIRSSSL